MEKKTLIIDGNSLANRAFYALPFLTNSAGKPSGAIFGFVNILIKVISEEKPDGILVAFDHARQTFRNQIFEAYKGTRKQTPPELLTQFPEIKRVLKLMNITVVEQEGIEADDIIGTATKKISGKKIILSGDRDLLQLITRDTQVWLTMKGVSVLNKIDETALKTEFNLTPSQVIDLKALMGDASDNIPGVAGVGEKTAHKLIDDFNSLDGIYANISKISGKLQEKLVQGKSMAELSYRLATIKTDCELDVDFDSLGYDFPFSNDVREFFEEYAFGSLLKRPELFSGAKTQNKNKILIDSYQKLDEFARSVTDYLCCNFEKLEFSTGKGKVYYLSPTFDMFSQAITLSDFILKMKPVFEKKNVLKLTCSAKSDMHKLAGLSVKLENYFDLSLASYLIHAGQAPQPISSSCDEWLDLKRELSEKLKEMQLDELYFSLELPLSEVLFKMELNGFKIDEKGLDELDREYSTKLDELTGQIYGLAGGEFNINSPKQVAEILFDKLGLSTWQNKKRSTGIEVLEELKGAHPIVEKIIDYRKYQKLKSTYVNVYKKICEEKGSIIHTNFNQTLTNTGRLSSTDPNLQNIPTNDAEGRSLRKIFISKFENGLIASADYSQIELRLLADMSGEEKLIETFKEGRDVHTQTACIIFGVKPDEVTPKMRREAKAVNFGIIYGISGYGLSQNIKVPLKSAQQYIDSFYQRYPKIKEFSDSNIAFAKENGFVRTKYGRIRHIPELASSNRLQQSFGERVAMNMPLQGTASDIIKFSMLKVEQLLEKNSLKSQLILQIHDELVLDVYPGEEKIVEKILHQAMESWLNLKVPLPISLNFGKNLMECK